MSSGNATKWVSVNSHRARQELGRRVELGQEYGRWPKAGWPTGEYSRFPKRQSLPGVSPV